MPRMRAWVPAVQRSRHEGGVAGERKKDTDKFSCPQWGHLFDPTAKGFGKSVIGEGVWSCDEEDLLEEDIIEAIEGLNGVLFGEYTSVEDQAYVFNRANGTDIDEYYWYEDSDCPADPDEMKSLDDFYWDTYDFEGETYYLVDDTINEADQEHEGKKWGIGAYGDPDDDGMFDCVIPLFDDEEDTVVDIMDT